MRLWSREHQAATSQNVIHMCRNICRSNKLSVAAVRHCNESRILSNSSLYPENKVLSFACPCVSTVSAVRLFWLLLMKLTFYISVSLTIIKSELANLPVILLLTPVSSFEWPADIDFKLNNHMWFPRASSPLLFSAAQGQKNERWRLAVAMQTGPFGSIPPRVDTAHPCDKRYSSAQPVTAQHLQQPSLCGICVT